MTEVERINSKGFGNGWHAAQLRDRASRAGQTMAEYFSAEVALASAFNVPGTAFKLRAGRIHYRFLDGSEAVFRHQSRKAA